VTTSVIRGEPTPITGRATWMCSLLTALPIAMAIAIPTARAQNASTLTPSLRSAVLDTVIARVTAVYVDADTARLIADALRARRSAHAYDTITNPAQLGEVVTQDLRSINGDLHLSLRYAAAPPQPARGGVGPFNDPARLNFGMGRAEILEGNVGYLEITGFTGGAYQDAVVDALRFLSRTDALIIDVRRNPGGASDMSHFIFSHFFPAEPVPTIDVRSRGSSQPRHGMSLASVPGPRRTDVPLYLLTSQGTGSAAEEFSFVLKNRHRATIVGTRTAGAGHMVAQMPIGNGFTVSLSVTRVSDPETGREWERVGVQPDIAVAPEQALAAAHAAALKTLLAAADPSRATTLRRTLDVIEARARISQSVDAASRFAGTYEGRVFSVRDGQFWYARREGALPEQLTRLTSDTFALGAARFQFAQTGGTTTLTIEQPDGTTITLARAAGVPR